MSSPIIIFSYNRPKHLNDLINSLIKNKDAKLSKIYFFCDGPKNQYDIKKINEIKKLLKNKKIVFYFKKFRKKNIGLAQNIIKGVSLVLKKHQSCIVLEDDLILNSYCIKFMSVMLKNFKYKKNIGSISANSYIDKFNSNKKFDFYISKRHSSWCWGTWARVWNKIDWKTKNLDDHFLNKLSIKKLSEAGNDLNLLLWGNYKKYVNSWAIRFNHYCIIKSLKSIHPRFSMIRNNGRDFSGTHEKFNFELKKRYDFNPKLGLLKYILNKTIDDNDIHYYIKNSHRRSFKLFIKYFLKNLRII